MMMKCFQCASSSPNFSFALVPEQLGWPTNLWETAVCVAVVEPKYVSDAVMLHPKINLISKLPSSGLYAGFMRCCCPKLQCSFKEELQQVMLLSLRKNALKRKKIWWAREPLAPEAEIVHRRPSLFQLPSNLFSMLFMAVFFFFLL
ncbi:uncharacterized protein LOC114580955 isoform X2 [Dendrobium catenatum]|uniref:uncharacterized protein LOC114580955 isoform X2 n=1 Tax=Dendrobium catenatum TaxID=906689 RepID=UPI00109F23BF|nr:uncharacterized protein LOC114580955 isoform X2 [Dendrobium catenatum]